MTAPLTTYQTDLLASIGAGDDPPTDSKGRQHLAVLRRRGFLTRERTADGFSWSLAQGASKPEAKRQRKPKRKPADA